ncbi:hypothetical protein HK104_002338 [Borealophlyctis nickersoniae]|nr:hypothetical protein HK104_002338 [Borealophlyctis nickersoniae]
MARVGIAARLLAVGRLSSSRQSQTSNFIFLLGGAAATGTVLTGVAYAEEETRRGYVPPRTKLSIYDEPEDRVTVVEEPSKLELGIRQARHEVSRTFSSTRNQLQLGVNEWIKLEQKFTDTLKRYVDQDEKLLPGALYVTVAGFAGSIVAKHRSFPVRMLTPTGFAAGAFVYLYPRTAKNVYSKLLEPQMAGTTVLDVGPKAANSLKGMLGVDGDSKNGTTPERERKS